MVYEGRTLTTARVWDRVNMKTITVDVVIDIDLDLIKKGLAQKAHNNTVSHRATVLNGAVVLSIVPKGKK